MKRDLPVRPLPPDGMPTHRRLRVYTQDPSVGRLEGQTCTLAVPYEALGPGPAGAWFVVEDRGSKESPLNLDAPALLMGNGLAPSTTDRQFACQMVYAVAMETYERFTEALGRDPGFGPIPQPDRRLRLIPRAFKEANAYYDREAGTVELGWELAERFAPGRSQPGSHVFLALSRDIVTHEISHALLDGLRPNFLRPTHQDVAALHEGFADLVAIFLHFTQRDVVAAAIERTQGRVDTDQLAAIGRQFGFELIDGRSPLRTAVHTGGWDEAVPSSLTYAANHEEHDLGAVLVSACFEAFRRIFEMRTARLRRVFAPYQGRLPSEGVDLLAGEACQLARQFLNIVIRAIDYTPSSHCTFGEYLRAMITADADLVADDPWAYREAMVTAFRRYGVTVPDVDDLSEESLLWDQPDRPIVVDELRFSQLRLDCTDGLIQWSDKSRQIDAAEALGRVVCSSEHGRACGLARPGGKIQPPRVMSLRTLRRVSPDGRVNFDTVA
ncbi:MAG: peptidase M4, partial [Gemmatimonadaceae bacterium]